MKFIDVVKMSLASGKGGPGLVSYRREKFVPRGGPDGGDGGRGGHVIFRANPKKTSLLDFRFKRQMQGQNGHQGGPDLMSGPAGEDLILEVPIGTQIKSPEGEIIKDFDVPGDFVFLEGGRGGKGNAFFKTSVNQAPDYAQPGEPAQEAEVVLELKLIADVGIIGFPNAGKSTLISRISAAKPKIADYPFTTLVPNLGVVDASEGKSFVVADIPGLIEGASQGVGLGYQFLRHIERTGLFIHLVDASEFSGRDPLQDYLTINNELKLYDESNLGDQNLGKLSGRPQIVVLNKVDSLSEVALFEVQRKFHGVGIKPMLISAATGQGIKELVHTVGQKIEELKDHEQN